MRLQCGLLDEVVEGLSMIEQKVRGGSCVLNFFFVGFPDAHDSFFLVLVVVMFCY